MVLITLVLQLLKFQMEQLLDGVKKGYNNAGDFYWDESKKTYLSSKTGYDNTDFTGAGNDVNSYYQWAMSTDLYGMAKTLTPPTPPTVKYNHTNVALGLEFNLIS